MEQESIKIYCFTPREGHQNQGDSNNKRFILRAVGNGPLLACQYLMVLAVFFFSCEYCHTVCLQYVVSQVFAQAKA